MASKYNIVDAAKDALTGTLEIAPHDVRQQRLAICNGCDAHNKSLHLCTVCGCVVDLKVKLSKSSCPMELWAEYKNNG